MLDKSLLNSCKIRCQPWRLIREPKRILIIRYQALGDVIITLPYLNSLKSKYPNTQFDFLTRKEDSAIPLSLGIFNRVFSIGGGRNGKLQFLYTIFLVPILIVRRYKLVIDLQNHFMSRLIRKVMFPKAWSEFDRFSPISAGDRNRLTIEALGLGLVTINPNFKCNVDQNRIHSLLNSGGWDGKSNLFILNPAGFFESRNWPLEYYQAFAGLWLKESPDTQFIILGIERIQKKANLLKQRLGNSLIDLSCKTSLAEAFAIVSKAQFILTEDSGLMHMAWVQGIPTLALFGSTRGDWSSPQGKWSLCLDSSDMECGPCMQEFCKFKDNRCLTRYDPGLVIAKVKSLLKQ